jgi:hypothetical protein
MSKRENEAQQKIYNFTERIRNVAEAAEMPADSQTGQLKFLNITPELQPLADFFANKFEAQQQANQTLSSQVGRLSNSVANLAAKMEDKVVHDKAPDLVISPFSDPDAADVAYVDSALPAEAWYPCTTADLAGLVELTASRLGYLFRLAGIQGNPKFHYPIRTGKSGVLQRYRATALRELFDKARAGKVNGIKQYELEKLEKYFRLHQLFENK